MKTKFFFLNLLCLYRIIIVLLQFNFEYKEWIYYNLIFSLMLCLLIKRDSKFDVYIIFILSIDVRKSWFDVVFPFPYFSHLGTSPFNIFMTLYALIHWRELRVDLEELCSQF